MTPALLFPRSFSIRCINPSSFYLFLYVCKSSSLSWQVMQISHKSVRCKHPSKNKQRLAVTPDDIMTTWKLINSFIQAKLLLLFINGSQLALPPLLCVSYLSQIHPPCTSPLCRLLELAINHCCCLTLSIFPETQGGCCRNWVRHNLQGSRA